MSDEEGSVQVATDSLLTTEFRDGQLQIVEMSRSNYRQGQSTETQILPDLDTDEIPETRYVQVLNSDKSVVQLDLLNMTLVRCEDGPDTTYKLVANADTGSEVTQDTVACVLQSSDQEDPENQETFVVMDGQQGPLLFLQSGAEDTVQVKREELPVRNEKLSPADILERAKALKRSAELTQTTNLSKKHGRKRKAEFPPPHELLASPNFKLFLYSCKMCHFKCNAVKEMTAHKAEEHSSGARVRAGRAGAPLQCAKCPYKANTHSQLMKHVQERHLHKQTDTVVSISGLDSKEVDEAHVLVCGACGFECSTKMEFKKHIKDEHGANAVSI
ncbi:uncharacterized protein LOC106138579 [Amyelois transitella]|uniref:uncharacterized protein LOC106138579 n=1 Tax=Amyelois transitella TaxID=680683 RepID=UPI00299049E8|nr:uncharacterized protein LOC106138579 [Amyelois transitella]XP_060808741.1 uncharacterized protein LOC106138579 [Amyelois transitella]XP_060808742.1 uncharacterized protein LOC106138579 [Amyelois transitella]